jgi:predicted Rossmann fold nucleotide-binding protein DprA/Smf involved in DNA uptake
MSTTTIREIREIIREEPVMQPRILAALADGPRTVPEIAAAIGCPTDEVLFWVMGMRRYNKIREVPGAADEGYFRYAAADWEARA